MPPDVPIPVFDPDEEGGEGEDEMIKDKDGNPIGHDVPMNIHETILTRLASAGAMAHEHMVVFEKILDLNYEQDRKVVSLVQSLGVREVTSQSGHTGIPLAGGVAQKAA